VYVVPVPTGSKFVLGSALSDYLLPDRSTQLSQTPTVITFALIEGSGEQVCLKMLRMWEDALYDLKDRAKRTSALLEGLRFNSKFAPHVYLGLLPLNEEEVHSGIQVEQRERIISNPREDDLQDVEYALVMERLDENSRLDRQLRQDQRLRSAVGMEFLAKAIGWMHHQLESAPDDFATFQAITSKLEFNLNMFEQYLGESMLDEMRRAVYEEVSTAVKKALEAHKDLFHERWKAGKIKRCHGDLKSTNLWLCAKRELAGFAPPEFDGRQLFALDGIDFRADFYFIDTLSDIAMMAVDLEVCLTMQVAGVGEQVDGVAMARHFLDTYLQEMGESRQEVQALLEYYMTEKALVCSYISISKGYAGSLDLAYRYLDIARVHAKWLAVLSGLLPD
jgi:aminoglycoside phosphotransferase family enzyme